MTARISPRILNLLFVLPVVAACGGGGGGGGDDDEEAAAAFRASLPAFSSEMTTFAADGESFPVNVVIVNTDGTSGQVTGPNPNFTLVLRPGGSGELAFGTGTFTYDPDSGLYRSNDIPPRFLSLALSRDAGVMIFGGAQNGGGFALAGVFGRESPDVGVQTGTAVYIGPSAYLAVENATGAVAGGSGGFLMTADFSRAAVDGRIALSDASDPSRQFFLDFTGAPISGVGFTASSLSATGLDGTVSRSGLEAKFYGAGAGQVAGVYTVDVTASDGSSQLAGVLLGDRQSFDADALAAVAQGGPASIDVNGGRIVLGSGSVFGGAGSIYPNDAEAYYEPGAGARFGADGAICLFSGGLLNC